MKRFFLLYSIVFMIMHAYSQDTITSPAPVIAAPVAVVAPVAAPALTPAQQQRLSELKKALNTKFNECNCDEEQLVGKHALDNFLENTFGKVALDIDGYVENGTSFNVSFDNDKALISGNYSSAFKNNKSRVWSLGGKAESEDGTYYMVKKKAFNYGFGVKAGFSFLLPKNHVNYKSKEVCENAKTLRKDSIFKLANRYEYLMTLSATLQQEIDNDIAILNTYMSKDPFDVVLNHDTIPTTGNPTHRSLKTIINDLRSNREKKEELNKLFEKGSLDLPISASWAKKIVDSDVDAFDKNIIEQNATGYALKWVDINFEFANENKKSFDSTLYEENFAKKATFFRGSISASFNMYHLKTKVLSFFNTGLSISSGYGYDLLETVEIALDSNLLVYNNKPLNLAGERIKVFNSYVDKNYDKPNFVAKLFLTEDIFFGKQKAFGLEFSTSIGITKESGAKVKAPFTWQTGILFSPLGKNKKTNEGVIGLMVGMNKLNFADTSSFNSDKLYFGIRVGLPLSAQLTRK